MSAMTPGQRDRLARGLDDLRAEALERLGNYGLVYIDKVRDMNALLGAMDAAEQRVIDEAEVDLSGYDEAADRQWRYP